MEMPGPHLYSCTHLCWLIVVCWNTGATQQPERAQCLGLFAHVHICTQIPHTVTCMHTCTYLHTHKSYTFLSACTHTHICVCTDHTCSYLHTDHIHVCTQTTHTHLTRRSHIFTSAHTLMGIQAIILTSAYRPPTFMSAHKSYTLISVHTPFCTQTICIHICIHITILICTHTDHQRSCMHMLIMHTSICRHRSHMFMLYTEIDTQLQLPSCM